MKNIIEILLKLITRLKYDKKKLVILLGISIIGFFILERIEFRKIILLILILVGVFSYYMKDDYLDEVNNNKEEFKNKLLNRGQTKTDKEVNMKNILNDFKVKNPKFNDKIYKINQLEQYLDDLKDFIKVNYKEIIFSYGETAKKNKNLDLYNNIKLKLKDYLNQVEIILVDEYYLDKSYLKLIAIKKDIIHLIHSMYFKVNYIYDDKINQFISKLEEIFKNIESQLKLKINKDFFKSPNTYKGIINMEPNAPEDYDPQDNLHLISITNKNLVESN